MQYKVIHWICDSTHSREFNTLTEAVEYVKDQIKQESDWDWEGMEIIRVYDSEDLINLETLNNFIRRQL